MAHFWPLNVYTNIRCLIILYTKVVFMKEPKYRIIEDYILKQIENGELTVGDQIMTEEQLSRMFSFSRMTVNKALNHLNEAGYVKRIPGKGSFVSTPVYRKSSISISSFSEDMKRIGLNAGSKLLTYQVVKAAAFPEARDKLGLKDDDLIHYFVRLRTGNNIPIALSYNYVSADIVHAIDISTLNQSFYQYLDDLGIDRVSKEMELSARLPDEMQKQYLQIDNTALLVATHVTYTSIDGKEVPFEYCKTCYNGDSYSYTFN